MFSLWLRAPPLYVCQILLKLPWNRTRTPSLFTRNGQGKRGPWAMSRPSLWSRCSTSMPRVRGQHVVLGFLDLTGKSEQHSQP